MRADTVVQAVLVGTFVLCPILSDGQPLTRFLSEMQAFYEGTTSVHLAVDVTVRMIGDDLSVTEGGGHVEYWTDGQSYRLKCRTDRFLGLADDFDYSYDGQQFRMNMGTVVSIAKASPRALPTAIPNPFYLPVEFLAGDHEECPTCVLTLDRLRELDILSKLSRIAQSPESVAGGYSIDAGADHGTVSRIRRSRPDGSISRTTLYFSPTASTWFPTRIVVEAFLKGSQTARAEVQYFVTSIETNQRIDPAVFRLTAPPNIPIWDSDRRRFIERPRDVPNNRP